jgi:methylated-DNA-[protein]-cysteine S-methyltransferase
MPEVLAEIACVFPSELGWMAARWVGSRITAFTFDQSSAERAAGKVSAPSAGVVLQAGGPDHVDRFRQRMQAYARGQRDDFLDLLLDDEQTTLFQRRVLAQCRRIAWGETLSYAQLAARAGSAGAARAVGNVMARNRFPLIIPCHRVVGAAGSLGGYSSPNGLATKRRLLDRERCEDARPNHPRRFVARSS